MESLLTLTGDNALLIVDDVYSAEQVQLRSKWNGFPGRK